MKLFALIILLLLIAASGLSVQLLYHKVAAMTGCDGTVGGCWCLTILHLLAACLMTVCYFDVTRNKD